MKNAWKTIGVGCAALSLIACASAPPNERVASSEAAIRAAEELGAKGVPSAALHLQLAKEEMSNAQQLIKNSDNERARFVLLRAESDAELALALSRESAESNEAQQAMDQVRALQGQ